MSTVACIREHKVRSLIENRKLLLYKLSVVSVFRTNGFRTPDNFIKSPAGWRSQSVDQVIARSGRAREIVSISVGYRPLDRAIRRPSYADLQVILDALADLYTLLKTLVWSKPISEELARWHDLVSHSSNTPAADGILTRVEDLARAEIDNVQAKIGVMPHVRYLETTEIGNRIAWLGAYARSRYGIDSHVLWPRILAVLSEEDHALVAQGERTYESLICSSVAFASLGAAITLHELPSLGQGIACMFVGTTLPAFDGWAFTLVIASFLFAYWLYMLATGAFKVHAETVAAMIDLNRLKVLSRFGVSFPKTVGQEHEVFKALDSFWYPYQEASNLQDDWALREPVAKSAADKAVQEHDND